MGKSKATSAASSTTCSSEITHVLLQADKETIIGTWEQIGSVVKDNLRVGMTTTLINGRKRVRGSILCLGMCTFSLVAV